MVTVKFGIGVQDDQDGGQSESKIIANMFDSFVEKMLVDYRWIFVCVFLLPLSLIYDIWEYCRCWIVFQLNSAPHNHSEKVGVVQAQVSPNEFLIKFKLNFKFYPPTGLNQILIFLFTRWGNGFDLERKPWCARQDLDGKQLVSGGQSIRTHSSTSRSIWLT